MIKEIVISGINGLFRGKVEVIFNHRKEIREVHNRSTHDEEKRTYTYGVVKGRADTMIFPDVEFLDTSTSVGLAEGMELKVTMHLQKLSDAMRKKTIEEEFTERGYRL